MRMPSFVLMLVTMVALKSPARCDEPAPSAKTDEVKKELTLDQINADITSALSTELKALPAIDEADRNAVDLHSKRGDLYMFLGEFQKAEDDYKKMVTLNPDLDSSHWRLGIAMYFASHPKEAASQFDKYHSFDNVDRENGIWRYLSHRKAFDQKKAREQLLKYEKDDRPPFREVYRLFDGTMTAEEVLSAIPEKLSEPDRNARLFYSNLYIGLNEVAEGRIESGRKALEAATRIEWPRKAGYGPNYMWHVGRLQLLQLKTE